MMPAAADVWYTAMTENASPPPAYFDFHFSECYSLVLDDYNLDLMHGIIILLYIP